MSDEEKSHYVFIKDFNRMMCSQTGTKNKGKKYFCMHCLQNFTSQEILNRHKENCIKINGAQKPIYEEGTIKFTNFDKQIPIPFKIYADIECFNKKVNIRKGESTTFYSKHVPYSIGAKLVCIDDTYSLPLKIFFGSNCVNKFLQWVFNQRKRCNQIIKQYFNKPIIMTKEDEERYNSADTCWICDKLIDKDKVRDHCHVTGKFRGAAHKKCNLQLKVSSKLPVIFHNLEGYDGHIIFRELNNFANITIQVIPKSSEKYMSFIINKKIIFLDSLQFLKSSLANLAANLEDTDHKHLLAEFPEDKLNLLKEKDIFPYEWIDDYRQLRYPRHPQKSAYHSRIKTNTRNEDDEETINKKHEHSKKV